ncbi:hypothetical protein HYE68_005449 [Fusarium pseudograminearum]|nr:hypothetical protein HYE68_005449 [Fusarium pseudograminearum]
MVDTNPQPITCHTCSKVCASEKQLKSHTRNIHKRRYSGEASSAAESKHAEVASSQETTSISPPTHGSNRGNTALKCSACNTTFSVQLVLEHHERQKHGIKKPAPGVSGNGPPDDSDDWESDQDSSSSDEGDFDESLCWPEHGEPVTGRLSCWGSLIGCRKKFNKGSDVVEHLEGSDCKTTWGRIDISLLFNADMEPGGRRLLERRRSGNFYQCPRCTGPGRGKYTKLSELFKHAESNSCGLKVRDGPLLDVYIALGEQVQGMFQRKWPEMYEYCQERMINENLVDEEEELNNYRMTGDISESYLRQFGY